MNMHVKTSISTISVFCVKSRTHERHMSDESADYSTLRKQTTLKLFINTDRQNRSDDIAINIRSVSTIVNFFQIHFVYCYRSFR